MTLGAYDSGYALTPRCGTPRTPVWEPETIISRLQGGAAPTPGIPGTAGAGVWAAIVLFHDGAPGTVQTPAGFLDAGNTDGWRFTVSTTEIAQLRARNGAGAEVTLNMGTLVPNRFNAMIAEVDPAGGFMRGTLNNGIEQSIAIVGYSPCVVAGSRQTICGRSDAASGSYENGGVHAVCGGTGPLTAAQKAAFWANAKLRGMGVFGEPAPGSEALNPPAESKWVAHVLTDRRAAGNTMAKSGTVTDGFRPPRWAF